MSDVAAASALPASRLVPLRGAARARHAMPAHGRWVTALGWQPIAYSEMHLCAHYYPLAIRFSRGLPLLGVILDEAYLTRSLVDASGTWQGGYMPMAVRTFPFQATGNSVDPFDDLVVPADTDFLSAEAGTPLCRDDGAPSSHLQTLHRLARQLLDSRRSLAAALDHLLIARLLVPLRPPPNGTAQPATPQLHTVDRARFAEIEPAAFAAMARHRFASVDIAVACQFSLHRLRVRVPAQERAVHPRGVRRRRAGTRFPRHGGYRHRRWRPVLARRPGGHAQRPRCVRQRRAGVSAGLMRSSGLTRTSRHEQPQPGRRSRMRLPSLSPGLAAI